MQLLEGRKAVVTGGSRGIGREICLLLAENGADVALAYRKSTVEAEQLREEIAAMGRSCIAVQADVSVSADVDRFVTISSSTRTAAPRRPRRRWAASTFW